MIISDLNHIEVLSEETETRIVGGVVIPSFSKFPSYVPTPLFAAAKGPIISTSTFTSTFTPPGYAGSSTVSSSSIVSYW
jgi:hypothetical protein